MSVSRQARRAAERKAEKKRTPGNSAVADRTPMQAFGDFVRLVPELAKFVNVLDRVVGAHDRRIAAIERRLLSEIGVPEEPK